MKKPIEIVFFRNVSSADDTIKLYRKLAMENHPDKGGDTATMQTINAEFDYVLKSKLWTDRKKHETNRQSEARAEGREWKGQVMTVAEVQAVGQKLYDALIQVAHLDDLIFEVCGDWLWVNGETKTYKDALKKAGFWWSSPKAAWYVQGSKSHSRGGYTMEQIRDAYGSTKVQDEKHARLSA